jgi:hypothetical protein
MKQLKKNFVNIKNPNKFIQLTLTFSLFFIITFLLTFIFNNKFKFIEKFTHPACNDNHDFRTYYFYSDITSDTNKNFNLKWNQIINNSYDNNNICYIKAPKKINDKNDDTYKKFTEYYDDSVIKTNGNIALFLGENLKDLHLKDSHTKPILNITNLKEEDANNFSNIIKNYTEKIK